MKNKKEFTLRNMYCNRKAKRQIKRIMSLFLVFPPIILNIHLVEFVSTPYVSPSVPKLMRYMNNNSALIYQIALIQTYCPDFWANVVAKGNYRFDVVSRYANVRSQIQDYIFSGEFPKFNEKLDV